MSFKDYREAYDEMETDEAVLEQRDRIGALRDVFSIEMAKLDLVEDPYRSRIAIAENAIIQNVLARKETTVLQGIQAKFAPGRKSTSWKAVAIAAEVPQGLIDIHTKVSKPSVKIKVLE